ncbi:MAG: DUF1573 domain-containing protein [Bdellovibrionota bacterium]
MEQSRRENSCMICLKLIFCLFFILPQISFAEEEAKAPKIKISDAIYEFGSVTQGSKVEHEFNFINEGNADLHIQRVVASCGCTASTADKDIVAPGEEGSIKVSFDTTGFSGSKTKSVRVYSNDLDSPVLMLSLTGTVEQDVIVEPKRVFFGDVVKGLNPGGQQREVTVSVKEGSDVNLGDVKIYSKNLEVKTLNSSKKAMKLLISLKPDAPVGELRDRAIISLTGARRKAINIPIFASIKGNLRVDPRTLSFGIIEGTETLERTVRLENLGPEKINVTQIKSSDKSVNVNFKELKAGKLYQIKVSVNPANINKDLRASVTVSTDSKEDKTVSFNVYGIIPPKG